MSIGVPPLRDTGSSAPPPQFAQQFCLVPLVFDSNSLGRTMVEPFFGRTKFAKILCTHYGRTIFGSHKSRTIFWVALWSHHFLGRTMVWWSHYGQIRGLWVARWSDQRSFGSHYGRTISWVVLRSDQRALGRMMVWSEGKVWKMVWSERSRVAHLNLGVS